MGNLREQMEALAQGITTLAHERVMFVGESKARTVRMLQAFGRERTAIAKALKSDLVADRVSRLSNVYTMRSNTDTMCEEFRQDHVRMRRSLRRGLAQSTKAVASFVATLRADVATLRADFAKARRHMTEMQRAELANDRRDRSREVAELIDDFHMSRGKMARELAEKLAQSTQEIRYQVSGLKQCRTSLGNIRKSVFMQTPDILSATQAREMVSGPIQTSGREPSVTGLTAKREPKIRKSKKKIRKKKL